MAATNIPVKILFGGVDNISPILGSINLKLSGVNKSLSLSHDKLKGLSFATSFSALSLASDKLSGLSSQFGSYLTASIDSYSNVTDNINRMGILLGKSPSDAFLGGMKKQWIDLSEISTRTASEISDVTKDIVNSGIKDEGFIKQFTKLSVLLSDASKGELDTKNAFSLINEFRNAFDLKLSDMPKVVDQIAYGKDQGNVSFENIHEGFKYAAPTWGSLTNATPAQYLAANAFLANHGIKGSVAGTALKNLPLVFTNMLDKKTLLRIKSHSNKEIQQTMQDYSSNKRNALLQVLKSDFEHIQVDDKTSNKIDLFKGLKALKTNLKKLKLKDQNAVIFDIFGKTALSSGLTAIRFLDELMKKVHDIDTKSDGMAQKMADSTRNTLSSQIKESQNAWDNFKMSILDSGTGNTLSALTGQFKDLADYAQGLDKDTKNMVGILGIGAYGVTEFSAKLMPVLLSIKLLGEGFRWVTGLIELFTLALYSNPILLAIGGITAAVIGLEMAVQSVNDHPLEAKKSFYDVNKGMIPETLRNKIISQDQINQWQANHLTTPEQREKYREDSIGSAFSGGKPVLTKESLVDHFKDFKKRQHEEAVSRIVSQYNQNLGAPTKTTTEFIFKGLPKDTTVIQKSNSPNPPTLKMGHASAGVL